MIFYLHSRKNVLTTNQTFLHSRCTGVTTSHVSTGTKQHLSFAIGAYKTLVDRCRRDDGFDVVSMERGAHVSYIILRDTAMYIVIAQGIIRGTCNKTIYCINFYFNSSKIFYSLLLNKQIPLRDYYVEQNFEKKDSVIIFNIFNKI